MHNFTVKQLAQPARLLLKYTGTEFEDKRCEQGDGELIIYSFDRTLYTQPLYVRIVFAFCITEVNMHVFVEPLPANAAVGMVHIGIHVATAANKNSPLVTPSW